VERHGRLQRWVVISLSHMVGRVVVAGAVAEAGVYYDLMTNRADVIFLQP
jgi:hypothetical protein